MISPHSPRHPLSYVTYHGDSGMMVRLFVGHLTGGAAFIDVAKSLPNCKLKLYELAATNNEASPGIREIFFTPIKHVVVYLLYCCIMN